VYIKHPIFSMVALVVLGFAIAKTNIISFNAPPIPGQASSAGK
jgi:hypothetical protein